ncbi:MAG: hypothetical protein KIG58_02100 [Bacteroidales bacterium]|nr:hypothetical protein [Bacteroidales bacterium]
MKKTIILAGFALMAAFSSCNKSEMPEAATTDGIKLNITVADLSPETKAVKKGWENGDRLNLYFEGWNEIAYKDNFQNEPDLILKYDGSKWQIESQVASLSSRLKESGGKFSAFWESSNDLINYESIEWGAPSVYYGHHWTKNTHTNNQNVMHANMVVSSEQIDYSFNGSTLTAAISNWTFGTKLKILVKTDDTAVKGNADNLVLQVKIGDDRYAITKGCIVVFTDLTISHTSSANGIGMQGAVAESDGLAFYYQYNFYTGSEIVFTLIDTSNGNKKQYTVKGKDLTTDSFKAISIDYNNFKEVE